MPSERAHLKILVPTLAVVGLLAHVLIFVSLFWTYIDYYDPYEDADLHPHGGCCISITSTGWQLLLAPFHAPARPRMEVMDPVSFPLAIILLFVLFVPAVLSLAVLILGFVRSNRVRKALKNVYQTAYWTTLTGLLLSVGCFLDAFLSHGGDLHDPVQNTHPAFGVPPLAFLVSFVCSYLLFKQYRRVEETGEERSGVNPFYRFMHTFDDEGPAAAGDQNSRDHTYCA